MKLYKRENYLKKIRGFYHDADMIKVLTGVRRCGKSSLMQTIIEELKRVGNSRGNLIRIDLDSRQYKDIKTQNS
ncbi:MAG: AAA family ATPase [Lachnospira eligens]